MRRIGMADEEIIPYNLRGDGQEFTEFDQGQPERVRKAREIISKILDEIGPSPSPPLIVEPGCSTGDISGFFTDRARVIGIDVTPGAADRAKEKWPQMIVVESEVEALAATTCDVLVLCEFLEHIPDPVGFMRAWAPGARYVVIGHPLVADGFDPEPGHLWAYYPEDFEAWFAMGGHEMREAWTFEMAGYTMAIGWGAKP